MKTYADSVMEAKQNLKTPKQKKSKTKLRVSSYDLESFLAGCKKSFYGTEVSIVEGLDGGLFLHNSNGLIKGFIVKIHKTRYRLEEVLIERN